MAGSQLKRLKASLKDQGIIGPQKSKKQKRQNAQDAKASNEKRIQRHEALASIREQFNPFQFKTNARGPKFEVTTNKPVSSREAMGISGRPGLTKAMGEQRRRETLLVEMQRRNKVGGLIDRRFGEDDPNMSLEDKMIERYTREQQRSHKKHSAFDLEDDDEAMGGLTHMGKPLFDDDDAPKYLKDDFEEDVGSGDESDNSQTEKRALKRQRLEEALEEVGEQEEGQPERKKTKKEIYDEIIAKSKLHKELRQEAKEEDNELRAEIDEAMRDLRPLLFDRIKPPTKDEKPSIVIAGKDQAALDREYDIQVKRMAADKRAAPTDKTKTEEEQAAEEANRLKKLEEDRLKRMRGEQVSDDEQESDDEGKKGGDDDSDAMDVEDVDEFGLGQGIATKRTKYRPTATELGFDDEDDFLIDDDLVASGSELEFDSDDEDEESDEDQESGSGSEEEDSDDDEFTKGLLTEAEAKQGIFRLPTNNTKGSDENGVPYTFPCPQSHDELLEIFKGIDVTQLPVATQRIRALYHPKLASENKERLGNFAQALVRHVNHLGNQYQSSWAAPLEGLTRHIHSLAKSFPIEVAKGYRSVIQEMEQSRPLALTVGDLLTLAGVGTTFPTSDHFHQVVTPAMIVMARYLGQKMPQSLSDYATGTFLSILAVQYQQFSKRYIPEVMNFCLNTLCALSPSAKPFMDHKIGHFPIHTPPAGTRLPKFLPNPLPTLGKLSFSSCLPSPPTLELKLSLLNTTLSLLHTTSTLWSTLPSFPETFSPVPPLLHHFPVSLTAPLNSHVVRLLQISKLARRPLELHHHKPLAIRTYVPKFEDAFDPNKHYDPDRERAEMAKLKAEHKRERKGAMRELRRDNAFVARENLRVKKEKDAAYEKKFKRLVAEIQGTEGQAANAYERERAARRKKR
ncbi:putative nucleolar complex protein 14 [Triangularia verruculosa]|uniref:Nucleolar complex protein 14 n=1 Tax=Triangularia verruculosa TaxID=2587418 RepID=A0AAN6XVG1_9PEZI|nr:putative nucleolar complex protein 14 [Triangularia verruculosa]